MPQAADFPALADGVNFLLRQLGDGSGALLFVAGHIKNLVADLLQIPKHPFFADNSSVFSHIGGGGRHIHELDKVIPVRFVFITQNLHLVQNGHWVNFLAGGEHTADGVKNRPIGVDIKIVGPQQLYHRSHAGWVKKSRADYRLLGLHAVGRLAGKQFIH